MRASEDEMAGWHKQCNGYELGQTPRDGEGQGGLACYSPWGCKESDTIRDIRRVIGCQCPVQILGGPVYFIADSTHLTASRKD